jgi:hypothetical protein
VAELRVGHEHAAVDDRGADAGAQRGEEHEPGVALGGSEVHLREAGGVGVVDQRYLAAEAVGEELVRLQARPVLVQVRDERHLAVQDGRRDGQADGGVADVVGELRDDLGDDVGDVGRGRLRGGRDAQSGLGELAGLQVNGCALDARTTNVDAEKNAHKSEA